MRTSRELIRFFGSSIKDENTGLFFPVVNELAVKHGYIVMPDACNESTMEFLEYLNINYNSTFYKTFEDVTSKNRWELLLDQLEHYASTYGTGFTGGNGFVPNDGDVVLREQDFKNYKVITAVTDEEMFNKCYDIIKSGIALKVTTLNAITDYMHDYITKYDMLGDFMENWFDDITNKEAIVQLCDKLYCTPRRKFDLFRYIIYKTTGSSMIIQNREMIGQIRVSRHPFDFSVLSQEQLVALSSIYYRFKNLFIAFKHNHRVDNKTYINRLNRLAPINHTPMVKGFWESIIENRPSLDEIEARFPEVNTFKLLQIYNGLQAKCGNDVFETTPSYLIRNGKVFVEKDAKPMDASIKNVIYMMNLETVLRNEITARVAANAVKKGYKYVKYNDNIDYACPTSEKNFIGCLPIGSAVPMKEHNYVGIYWKNEWGTHDFDLHMVDEHNRHYGWNSSYRNDDSSVIFSGDMTNADPEAAEVMYCRRNCPNGSLQISRYDGEDGSRFKLFIGSEEITDLHINYMVNPDTIRYESEIISTSETQTIGMIYDNVYYAMVMGSGNHRIPTNPKMIQALFRSTITKARTMLRLRDVLDGITTLTDTASLTDEEMRTIKPVEILDLTQATSETLISLFS